MESLQIEVLQAFFLYKRLLFVQILLGDIAKSNQLQCLVAMACGIKNEVKRIKPFLIDKYHVNLIGLFGSVVRDDYSPTSSDIDIIVDFSKPIGIEFVDLAEHIEKVLNKKVDLVSKKGIKSKYLAAIEPEIIYV